MTARAWTTAALGLAAVLAIALAVRHQGRGRSASLVASAHPAYVGAGACAECHQPEYEQWRGSHHDLAMQEASEATVLGDFAGATFEHGGVVSTFLRRGGRYVVRTDGPDGALADFEIAYTFGVTPLQQYLIALPGGRYQCLGIAWDARPREEGGQRWFHLYPDQALKPGDPLHWTGIDQTWNHMCAECHSTNVRKTFSNGRYQTTWSAIDVSCEACHGPGSAHAQWARLPEGNRPADPTTGLVALLRDRKERVWTPVEGPTIYKAAARVTHAEVEACAHCHARRGTLREPRVPGRPLADTHRAALLDEGLYHADGQIDGEVFEYGSFLQSRMYHAGVTCSDCHNPHTARLTIEGNALCAQCHSPAAFDTPAHHFHPADSLAARCVACHMPPKTYMIVDPRRDHSFRVPRPDLADALGTPDVCTACHTDRTPAWAARTVVGWYGARERPRHYAQSLHAARASPAGAGAELAALVRDAGAPAIARATAAAGLTPARGAGVLPALRGALTDPSELVRSAAADAADAWDSPDLLPALAALAADPVGAVRIEAGLALSDAPAGLLSPEQRASRDRAAAEYRASQELNADRPEGRFNLGVLEQRLGRPEEAGAAYRAALGIDPTFVPARVNLAEMLASGARADEAIAILREGLRRDPEEAVLHHAIGLALVRAGRASEALEPLRRAAELRPQDPRYGYVLGIGLHSAGKPQEALTALSRVHLRHPADRDALAALATINRDLGRRAEAAAYAQKLADLDPQDPVATSLLEEVTK